MQKIVISLIVAAIVSLAGLCRAVPPAPVLTVHQKDTSVDLEWTQSSGASGYTLTYAPYPGVDYLGTLDLGNVTQAGFSLWPGAAFYVALQAYDGSGAGGYSNIETIIVAASSAQMAYPIVDTGQTGCYDAYTAISCPSAGQTFAGQDGQVQGNQPDYTDNGDGTVTDNVTGLMWQQDFSRTDWGDAQASAAAADTGGYADWRVPTIKELYSLMNFTGDQGSGSPDSLTVPSDAVPFIDTGYFSFEYGQVNRYIDAQYVTSTEYVSTVMNGQAAFFGLNLADGRIKGYGQNGFYQDGSPRYYARFVRGSTGYGINEFKDNGDDTVTDNATGLMWSRGDSGNAVFSAQLAGFTNSDGSLNWEEALSFAETADLAGYDDWRLPNAKELHSIVDYSRSPDTTFSAAVDPVFDTTVITNEAGEKDYPFFWSSTTFNPGDDAVYIAFGRGLGYFSIGSGASQFYDVHGAGCQRTDPKEGAASYGKGPQGDVRRVYNHVRLVRDMD